MLIELRVAVWESLPKLVNITVWYISLGYGGDIAKISHSVPWYQCIHLDILHISIHTV